MKTRYTVLFGKLLLATLVAARLATLSAETSGVGDEDAMLVAPGVTGHRVQGPVLVSMPSLVYPAIAKQANATGTVHVKLLVGSDGRVLEAHAVSGPFLLRSYAEKTIRQWRYAPAVFNSHPIEATTYASLNFHM